MTQTARTETSEAARLIFAALARGMTPDMVVLPSVWARDNLVVADGPIAGEKWSTELTPYAPGILDCLAADNGITRVSVRKSAQVGMTGSMIAWLATIMACTPAKAMLVFPTILSVQDFNREKLAPAIDQTVALRDKVRESGTRSLQKSTALSKRFPGGSLVLTGANSASDLRSKTIKFMCCDEVDEWPLDLDKQGDPMDMVDARQIAFHATGDYKKFEGSTPTIKGISRIDNAFEEGDQRYFECPCPGCGHYQRLVFGGKDVKHGLKFNREYPYNAYYICIENGCPIEHHQKRAMVQAGRWRATKPEPGRHPSFHIDAISSLLTTWDNVAEAFVKSKDDPNKLKTFTNLWLGEAWEEKGDAPDWQRLFVRREMYPARVIPIGGLVITVGCDVQTDGIYYEVVAWGRDRKSWSIDAGFLRGNTADPDDKVWSDLDVIYDRRYPDAYGNYWQADAFAVDSGYNSNQVYLWTRSRPKARAIKGNGERGKAAISSAPTKVEINFKGKRSKRGAELWHVGTWDLKATFYANLNKDGLRDGSGADADPPGYCYFTELHDEQYFRQITAEYLKKGSKNGRATLTWEASGPNHLLDCRIYNMAMAAHLGMDRLTAEEWLVLEKDRTTPPRVPQGDLLDRATPTAAAENVVSKPVAREPAAAPQAGNDNPASGWFGKRPKGWMG
ncbi:phage terminase large subunit family protein [Thalassospira mesophila]|uniref:phage terminase large subunit family protein n=1 Tax=Thalassospira mesophila TaxID=1293891 RepID=UPI000A1E747B|nr:terminase gpA endonuclease subunit [Thalassospira mesophila]